MSMDIFQCLVFFTSIPCNNGILITYTSPNVLFQLLLLLENIKKRFWSFNLFFLELFHLLFLIVISLFLLKLLSLLLLLYYSYTTQFRPGPTVFGYFSLFPSVYPGKFWDSRSWQLPSIWLLNIHCQLKQCECDSLHTVLTDLRYADISPDGMAAVAHKYNHNS